MEFRHYVRVLNRRRGIVLLTTIAAMAVVALSIMRSTPVYTASALVRVSEVRTTPAGYSDLNYMERLQNTYVELAHSRSFMEQTIEALQLSLTPEQLSNMVKVQALQNTELIRVSASSPVPAEAAGMADVIATLLMGQTQPMYQVSVVEGAAVPVTPSGTRPEIYLALAAVVGILCGIGLAFLLENLDSAIHGVDDLDGVAGIPLLAWIPTFRGNAAGKDCPHLDAGNSQASEAFRMLSTNTLSLTTHARDHGRASMKTLLVTSAEPRAGKSTIVANLAVAVARKGHRVVVVDGDLRRPCLHRTFGLPNDVGLSDVIENPHLLSAALRETTIQGLQLLPGGTARSPELLGSPNMRQLLQSLSDMADVVLVDGAPVLASADPTVLASMVDGIVLVAARDYATGKNIGLALKQLERVGGRMLGMVFNRAREESFDYLYRTSRSNGAGQENGSRIAGTSARG